MGRKKRGFKLPQPHKLSYSQRFHMKRTFRSVDWPFLGAVLALLAAVVLAIRFAS